MKNSSVIVDRCKQRIEALLSGVPAKAEITIDGTRYTRAQVVAIYQASLDTRAALVKSRAQVKVDLAARSTAEVDRLAIEAGMKAWVVSQFGAESNEAYEFGYTPKKPAHTTAETKANAVKLAKATREARGTMGKKKKLSIKGTLVVPTVPAAPATTAPAAPVQNTSTATGSGAPAAPAATAAPTH